jgi:ferredoxin
VNKKSAIHHLLLSFFCRLPLKQVEGRQGKPDISTTMIASLFKILLLTTLAVSALSFSFNGGVFRRQLSVTRLNAKVTYKVTVQHGGKDTVLDVREDESILSVAIEAGIDLPHDCDMGVCLTCPTRIVSGEVDQTGGTLDDSVIEQGFALSCCCYPRSDVTIRSIDEEELLQAQFSGRS